MHNGPATLHLYISQKPTGISRSKATNASGTVDATTVCRPISEPAGGEWWWRAVCAVRAVETRGVLGVVPAIVTDAI